jgi:hypothetical protein
MIQKNRIDVACVGLLILLSLANAAFAAEKLVLVANQKSLDLAKEFIATLNNESIPISISLDQYDKIQNEKYIFVLGGAPEFVKQVLKKEDIEAANQAGGKIFIRENVFAAGQVIVVCAGQDEEAAANIRKSNRKTWWTLLVKWFDLDTAGPMPY